MPSAWARLRAASASSSEVIATLPLRIKRSILGSRQRITGSADHSGAGDLSRARQENLLRSVGQPDPPGAEEIDAENKVGVFQADIRDDQRGIADDLSPDFHM